MVDYYFFAPLDGLLSAFASFFAAFSGAGAFVLPHAAPAFGAFSVAAFFAMKTPHV
ncbi:hypothetical protein ACSAZL_09025 [Methanosarcina sp. T3]|uniref:hypothetical protein n=1 Tax=Methanosarcina sp. T3 TaxID=3439062 RepID=UPI003F874A4C